MSAFFLSKCSYIGSIQWRDLHPILLDICKLLCDQLVCTEHSFHKASHYHMDWHTGVGCKLCCLGIPNHCHILQFWLQKKILLDCILLESKQSSKVWKEEILLGEHWVYGSPVVPGGQVHTALWFVTEHLADWLQGLFVVQGFTQLLEMHAWNEGHSSSDEQPASMGAAKNG